MVGCSDVEVAREAGASVMGGGVFVCWDCNGGDSRDGDASELFCIAGVDCSGGNDSGGGIFEAAVRGSGVSCDCRNDVGVCENCE